MTERSLSTVGSSAVAGRFQRYQKLSVRQKKRWLEMLLSFEMKNAYEVYDESQQPVLKAKEEGEGIVSLLKRVLMGPMRPFDVLVTDLNTGEVTLQLRRPFRFFFHRLEVRAGDGTYLGAIQKEWSWVRRIYTIEDASGAQIGQLFGPFLKPWTFEIRQQGETIGQVAKRWSGLGKELFSDADNFGVELGQIPDPNLKALAFAATVLIDVVHFERSKNN